MIPDLDFLLDKNRVLSYMIYNLKELVPETFGYDPDGPLTWGYLVKSFVLGNIDVIFEFAESPIEKIFLNSLNIFSFFRDPLMLFFTAPLNSITEFIKKTREDHRKVKDSWRNFQKETGEESVKSYFDYIEGLASLSDDVKGEIMKHVFLDVTGMYNMYFVSIQSTFTDIIIDRKTIRPDIYIWVPSNPAFNLIVECDGYATHSRKNTFSNDRIRDRLLQTNGFQVFRFSGNEINSDPRGKAKELYDYLASHKQVALNDE